MSKSKSSYPFRPDKRRPKGSQSGGGRRKTWMSLRETDDGRMDTGARLNFPWWKAPMYLEARLKKWGAR